MRTKSERCEHFLKRHRAFNVKYVRDKWLERFFGEKYCEMITYEEVEKMSRKYKKLIFQNYTSRHYMRLSMPLGEIRWGLAVLAAKMKFGEKAVAETQARMGIKDDYGTITLGVVLPQDKFGKYPLGKEW